MVIVGLNASLVYIQNTKEKFDAEPEDCDQKEMYKLLVCLHLMIKVKLTHKCMIKVTFCHG